MADGFSSPELTWNIVDNLQQVLTYSYMQHAFLAGGIVAVTAAVVGWFMILRDQTYAGHTLSVIAFPGAAGAALLGLPALSGFFVFCLFGAFGISALAPEKRQQSGQSAVIGSIQAFAVAVGLLFASLYHGALKNTSGILFGSFIGISISQVVVLAAVSIAVLCSVALLARQLLFASVDGDVAQASGVRTSLLAVVFLVLLGVTVAETSQITGALLVFSLLVGPPAAAQHLSSRPSVSIALAVAIGLLVVWLALFVAYFVDYPVGFLVTTFSFGAYLLGRMWPGRRWAAR